MKTIYTVALFSLLLTNISRGQSYQLTDLGALVGADSYAQGINNQGQIVGYWQTTNGDHAFLYEDGQKCGNQWHDERHPFKSQHWNGSLEFTALQPMAGASSHVFSPNVPRHGPPTSSPVQVNQSSARAMWVFHQSLPAQPS